MIFQDKRCIFIHIPKTAGTSIVKSLSLYSDDIINSNGNINPSLDLIRLA